MHRSPASRRRSTTPNRRCSTSTLFVPCRSIRWAVTMPLADSVDVWIGAAADVERTLNQVHADLDEKRHFILDVQGGNIAFLHSAQEVMVTGLMAYFLEGKCMSLYMLILGEGARSKPQIEYGEDE